MKTTYSILPLEEPKKGEIRLVIFDIFTEKDGKESHSYWGATYGDTMGEVMDALSRITEEQEQL